MARLCSLEPRQPREQACGGGFPKRAGVCVCVSDPFVDEKRASPYPCRLQKVVCESQLAKETVANLTQGFFFVLK